MILSNAQTPVEFQTEVVQEFNVLIGQLKRKQAKAKPREAERVLYAIDELQGLLGFISSVKFEAPADAPSHASADPAFLIPPPSSKHRRQPQ